MIGTVRMMAALVLLGLSGCAHGGRAGPDAWRTDWRVFGEAVAPYTRAGVAERAGDVIGFNRRFGGTVEWRGTVRSVHSNGVGVSVEMEMPTLRLPLRDGTELAVGALELHCAVRDPECAWTEEMIGQRVVFRTELVNRTRGILPVVRVQGSNPKDRRIVVETDGAALVRVGRR